MELLYYYALAHQDSFDVRWMRSGSVQSSIIFPLAKKLKEEKGLSVKGGCRVKEVNLGEGGDVAAVEVRVSSRALTPRERSELRRMRF